MKRQELKQLIKEQIKLIKEEEESFPYDELEDYVINNRRDIQVNMETYGWDLIDLKHMTNYYDLAHLLNIDTRKLKNVDTVMYGDVVYDILSQYMKTGNEYLDDEQEDEDEDIT